jgi:hypothetical protein
MITIRYGGISNNDYSSTVDRSGMQCGVFGVFGGHQDDLSMMDRPDHILGHGPRHDRRTIVHPLSHRRLTSTVIARGRAKPTSDHTQIF